METPLSVYRKLANCSYSYLFESVEGGEKWARYSLIGLKADRVIKIIKNQIEIHQDGSLHETFISQDPLEYIDQLQKSFILKEDPNLPKFNGGLVGFFSGSPDVCRLADITPCRLFQLIIRFIFN